MAAGEERVDLLLVVGEEKGSDGARAANNLPATSRWLINGEPTESRLATGAKGSLRVTLRTRGRAAHSAYAHLGRSAIVPMLELLPTLPQQPFPIDPVLGETTVNIGTIRGGTEANVVPASAEAELMFRLVGDVEEVKRAVEQWVDGRAEIEYGSTIPAQRFHVTDGFDTAPMSYTTDIPLLDRWGTPLLFGPGSIHVAHTPDEYVEVGELRARRGRLRAARARAAGAGLVSAASTTDRRIPVAVLGATGAVGQTFVRLLRRAPVVPTRRGGRVGTLGRAARTPRRRAGSAASCRRRSAAHGRASPANRTPCSAPIVFSALDASVAGEVEQAFARAGRLVLTQRQELPHGRRRAARHPGGERRSPGAARRAADAARLAGRHRDERQLRGDRGHHGAGAAARGASACGSCSSTTMQAVSGAGYPGVPSLDILGNVIPFIGGRGAEDRDARPGRCSARSARAPSRRRRSR